MPIGRMAEQGSHAGPGGATAGDQQSSDTHRISPPAISLPKGGGAIRDIGEKFAANPVTGTGPVSVPLATDPGSSGFAPCNVQVSTAQRQNHI